MRIRRFSLVLVGTLSVQAAAQQKEDLYSVPAKAKYQPSTLAGKKPLTRPERTNYTETSLYADVVAFIDSLKLMMGAKIETGSIGKTSEGRDLPYVIASRPLYTTPAAARAAGRPVAYIQANIHSGEVEGKEAMLAMLRDLLFDTRPNILDSIVLIVQPDYNADGNEKLGVQSRLGSQNGPVQTGTRSQAQGWNLNRDYIGADAPETRASLAMMNKWNPDLFMDLHTTDGSVHGYALTYAPTLTPAAVTTGPYLFKTMMPEIRRRVRDRQGFEMNDYGDFSRARAGGAGGTPGGALGGGGFGAGRAGAVGGGGRGDTTAGRAGRAGGGGGRGDTTGGRGGRGAGGAGGAAGAPPAATAAPGVCGGRGGQLGVSLETIIADSIPTSGWVFSTYESFPRYGSNYYGLRGRLSILSEAFSHDPFQRRIASTYAFVGEILSYVAEHRKEIIEMGKKADEQVAGWAKNPSTSPQLGLQTRMDTTRIEDVRVEMITAATDPAKCEMGLGNRQRTGIVKLVKMPVMASFTPTLTRTLPFAYVIDPAAADSLLPILKIHGVAVERLTAPATVTAQGFTLETIVDRGRNETPRTLKMGRGTWTQPASRSLPAGTLVVRAGQQLGLLAFYLLEPESEDGLQSYLANIMAVGKEFPVARITASATLATRPTP